jgi:hypothetical protein
LLDLSISAARNLEIDTPQFNLDALVGTRQWREVQPEAVAENAA